MGLWVRLFACLDGTLSGHADLVLQEKRVDLGDETYDRGAQN